MTWISASSIVLLILAHSCVAHQKIRRKIGEHINTRISIDCGIKGCYAQCYDYTGNDDLTLSISCKNGKRYNYKNCQHLCTLNKKCEHFTFNKLTSCCYLKSGKVSKIKRDQYVVSGPKYCPGVGQKGKSPRQIQFLETTLNNKEFAKTPIQSVLSLEHELLGSEFSSNSERDKRSEETITNLGTDHLTAIGAGIGGCALVLLSISVALFFICRNKTKQTYNSSFQESNDGNSSVRASDEYVFDVRIEPRGNNGSDNDATRYRTL